MTARPRRTIAGIGRAARALVDLGEPAVDGRREQPRERRLALRRPGVALEEQPLERPQLGPAQVGPHGREGVGRVVGQLGERRRLAPLDLLDDREQQLVPRPEVVEEHAVARADRRRRPRAATARRCRRAANASISASSSSLRRRSSGGRGIAPAQLLAARLEALRLQVEVALREAPHEHADGDADGPALVDALPDERPLGLLRDNLVRRRASCRPATAGATSTRRRARPRSPPTRASAGAAA